jgi:hypothetical protein
LIRLGWKSGRSGFTVMDMFVFMAIVAAAIMLWFKADDFIEARYRTNCWESQKALELALHQVLTENELEMFQVMAAYTIFDPNSSVPYRMVIIPYPLVMDYFDYEEKYKELDPSEFLPPFVDHDLSSVVGGTRILCPLRKGKAPKFAVVDYWYLPMQRWYCMHSKLHN